MSVSPYALLCACRPQPASSPMTTYDLRAQPSAPSPDAHPHTLPPLDQPDSKASAPAFKARTHYISDIHTRHTRAISKALCNTSFSQIAPITPPAPPVIHPSNAH